MTRLPQLEPFVKDFFCAFGARAHSQASPLDPTLINIVFKTILRHKTHESLRRSPSDSCKSYEQPPCVRPAGQARGYLYTIADNKGSPTSAPAPAFSAHHTERSGASAYSLRLSSQNAGTSQRDQQLKMRNRAYFTQRQTSTTHG